MRQGGIDAGYKKERDRGRAHRHDLHPQAARLIRARPSENGVLPGRRGRRRPLAPKDALNAPGEHFARGEHPLEVHSREAVYGEEQVSRIRRYLPRLALPPGSSGACAPPRRRRRLSHPAPASSASPPPKGDEAVPGPGGAHLERAPLPCPCRARPMGTARHEAHGVAEVDARGLSSGRPLPLAMRVSRASMEHMNLFGFMPHARGKASR